MALVSVVIPAFNAGRFIAEAIESVLAQTFDGWDLIVIDDGSTDDTAAAVRPYLATVRYEHQENAGSGAARNRGVGLSGGELLAFLDADDRFRPTKLERQVAALAADDDLDVVFGRVTEFLSTGLETPDRPLRSTVTDREARLPGTMLVHRTAYDRVGPWSEELRVEALDWFARADECELRSEMLPLIVLERRLHSSNKTLGEGVASEYLHAIKAALDRRKAKPDG